MTHKSMSDFRPGGDILEKMMPDLDLLRQYARHRSEEAFASLVRRHLNLVYSAALRQVRSPQLAEEVAQSVFTDLSRNAASFAAGTILAAWLYQVTRRTAIDVVRREVRRQARERIATEMNTMNAAASSDWTHIEPLLDEAMEALDDTDRAAILLRYFENKSLREVGQTLGTSDDAAQKRVSRAVERLREFFTKRGVTVGASGLVLVISTNAVQAAPVGLAVTISTAAAMAGTAASTSTAIAATKTIAMTTLQKTIAGAMLAVAVGTGIYEARQVSTLRARNQTLEQQQAPLTRQIQQLQSERDDASNRVVSLTLELATAKKNNSELLKLRGEVGMLRAQLADVRSATSQSKQPPLATARDYYMRADHHKTNREYDAELEDLNKAIELDPNMAEAYMDRGDLYALYLPKEQGGFERAVAERTRCLEIDPKNWIALSSRASELRQLKRYDEAISDWSVIIEGDLDFARAVGGKTKSIAKAYFWRGDIYQSNKRDYAKAIADYTAALQLDPNIGDAHRLRGVCYELIGETEKAQQDFAIEPKRN
jgi:RNA polymerase sigma factor (sigma-70 family)